MLRLLVRSTAGILAVLLLLQPLRAAAAAPRVTPIIAAGEVCYLSGGTEFCFPLEVTFDPAGGPVLGTTHGRAEFPVPGMGGSFVSTFEATFTGTFEGGDGGEVAGTWQSISHISAPAGYPIPANVGLGDGPASGTWAGTLWARGSGDGSLTGTDSGGNPAAGSWTIAYSAKEFLAAQPRTTDTPSVPTLQPAAPPTRTPTPVPAATPADALPGAQAALLAAIEQERAAMRSADRSGQPPVLAPWYYGQIVRLGIDEAGEPFAQDFLGQSAPLGQFDATLESPSADVLMAYPEVDWGAALTSLGQRAYNAISGMADTSFQFVTGTLESLQPAASALDFLSLLTSPPEFEDVPLSEEEGATLQSEVVLLALQSQQDSAQVDSEGNDGSEQPETVLDSLIQAQLEEDRRHYVDLLEAVSQEEWDRLVEGGYDPAEVMRSRRSMNRALQKIRAQMGEEQLNRIEEQFGLDAATAGGFRERLLQLGADPEQADDLSRATAALRVLMIAAEDHTVSTGGLLGRVTAFVDAWIVRSQAQALAVEAAGSNSLGLSEAQLALIQDADRQGLIRALTEEQELADDPIIRLLLEQVQGGE